jgi:hypothetical protein
MKTIEKITKNCDICQRMKHQRGKRKGYLGKYEDPIAPKAHLNVDVMGPNLEKSNKNILSYEYAGCRNIYGQKDSLDVQPLRTQQNSWRVYAQSMKSGL